MKAWVPITAISGPYKTCLRHLCEGDQLIIPNIQRDSPLRQSLPTVIPGAVVKVSLLQYLAMLPINGSNVGEHVRLGVGESGVCIGE